MPRQGIVEPELDPAVIAQTGVAGLDDVLNGGLARGRLYLVEGMPGSGNGSEFVVRLPLLVEKAIAVEQSRRMKPFPSRRS